MLIQLLVGWYIEETGKDRATTRVSNQQRRQFEILNTPAL